MGRLYLFYSGWQAEAWFASYWQRLRPDVRTLEQEHVEMLSRGNEYDRLEDESPEQWDQRIQKIHTFFSEQVIYSMNWASFAKPLPSWLRKLDTGITPALCSITPLRAVGITG